VSKVKGQKAKVKGKDEGTMTKRIFIVLLGAVAVSAVLAADANHPTGTTGLLLIDKLGGTIRFFDPTTFKERSSIKVATNPHDFALTADRKTAYVPLYGDGIYGRNPNPGHDVLIVDMESQKVVGSVDVSPYRAPHGIQLDSQGTVYVTSDLDRKLIVIDPKARKMTNAIDTEGTTHWIGILPNGSKIYATNKSDPPFVSVIDAKASKIVSRIQVPGGTQGVAVSPDGKQVIIMASAEPTALVIDPTTDTIVDRVALKDQKGGGYKVYYSPDGRHMLTMNLGSTLVNIFDAGNLHAPQRTATVGRDPMGIAFSADGKTALVANHGDGSVSVIDLVKMETVNKFKGGTGIETLTYY
jgi:DNA-binding beta-propeller fold protein YncE